MIKKQSLLKQIKGGLIVSCQARKGWPMYGPEIMAAFANAADIGGAVGIRANLPENIKKIKEQVSVPLFGIYKKWSNGSDVYITPTFQYAKAVVEAGADVVAVDATKRKRPNNETILEIVSNIKREYPYVLVMGDIGTYEDGCYAEEAGCDMVATTLSGYTKESSCIHNVNFRLINELASKINIPVIAEGKINTPSEAKKALQHGAYAAVVGTMITRPEKITETYVKHMKG